MIKKFQRSSADHVLQIPHLLRTPQTLLRTIAYIEERIMNKYDDDDDIEENHDVTSTSSSSLFSSTTTPTTTTNTTIALGTTTTKMMNNSSNNKEIYSSLFIYLFCWDRYRMIAKDFTLQHGVLQITSGMYVYICVIVWCYTAKLCQSFCIQK